MCNLLLAHIIFPLAKWTNFSHRRCLRAVRNLRRATHNASRLSSNYFRTDKMNHRNSSNAGTQYWSMSAATSSASTGAIQPSRVPESCSFDLNGAVKSLILNASSADCCNSLAAFVPRKNFLHTLRNTAHFFGQTNSSRRFRSRTSGNSV